jgi:hypothetical protein
VRPRVVTGARRDDVMCRILCVIANAVSGSAGPAETVTNGPGRVYEQPNPYGICRLMRQTYEACRIPLERVAYLVRCGG